MSRLCRLCLKTTVDTSYEVINDYTKENLDFLVLKLNIDVDSKPVMCCACSGKLNAALDFKSICLKTDNIIIPYVHCEDIKQLDLREIYMTENGNKHPVDIPDDQKICRLCMQLVKNDFRCIGNVEIDAIQKLVPEMNINVVKDPVVCKPCYDSLSAHNCFLKSCLEVEKQIGNTSDISITENSQPSLDLLVKSENFDREYETSEHEMEMSIKTEYIEIKSEENEEGSNTDLSCLNEETKMTNTSSNSLSHVKSVKMDVHDVNYLENNPRPNDFSKAQMYKCNDCTFETSHRKSLISHLLTHTDLLQVPKYKCNLCTYESVYKCRLKQHQLVHKSASEVQMYKCDNCTFETKHKRYITAHQLVHTDPSLVPKYKCNLCSYKSTYRCHFKQHLLVHKSASEVQMYKCDECSYETKQRSCLISHQLKHKDPSQVPKYKCDICYYESRYKHRLKQHQLVHKSASEVQMYKCNDCTYETKHKNCLISHQLIHKDPSQVQMYKCDVCEFKSRYKHCFKKHQFVHNSAFKAEVYKCDECTFETKRKGSFTAHQSKHIRPSQM